MADAVGDVAYHDPDDLPRPLNRDRKRSEEGTKRAAVEDGEGVSTMLDSHARPGDGNLNTLAEPKFAGPQEDAFSPQAEQRSGKEAVVEQPVA